MGKPLAEKLLIPDERDGIEPLEIENGRFAFFKTLFGKSGKMAKINLFAVLFALPAIVWFLYTYILRKRYDTSINYSGNIGFGYSMIENAAEQGSFANFYASLLHYAILVPLMILAFIGIGGAFYAMRKLAQGDERIAKNFFKGIKVTFADFFMYGILVGLAIFVFAINLTVYDAYGIHLVWKVFGTIGVSLLVVLILCYLLYACTLSSFYKAGLKTIIKNSVLFIFNLPIQSIFFSLLGAVPIIVLYFSLPQLFLNADNMLITIISTVGVSLFLFLGISLVLAAWTVYSDYVYELSFGAAKVTKKSEQKKQSNNKAKAGR